MEELKYTIVVVQTYRTSNSSTKTAWNILIINAGAMETKSTAITMIMSIATFFSRLTRADACCPETAPTIWLLWRWIAMKIPICFAIGRMTRNTAKTSPSTNPVNLGRIKFFTMATSSQAVPAVVTVLTASVDKKRNIYFFQKYSNISFPFLCYHKIFIR